MTYFSNQHRQQMIATREALHSRLAPVADAISQEVSSFDGFVLFQQDEYHPDSAGSIAQINAHDISLGRLAFQDAHVVNRRVDLDVSTLGQTFRSGRYALEKPHEPRATLGRRHPHTSACRTKGGKRFSWPLPVSLASRHGMTSR